MTFTQKGSASSRSTRPPSFCSFRTWMASLGHHCCYRRRRCCASGQCLLLQSRSHHPSLRKIMRRLRLSLCFYSVSLAPFSWPLAPQPLSSDVFSPSLRLLLSPGRSWPDDRAQRPLAVAPLAPLPLCGLALLPHVAPLLSLLPPLPSAIPVPSLPPARPLPCVCALSLLALWHVGPCPLCCPSLVLVVVVFLMALDL